MRAVNLWIVNRRSRAGMSLGLLFIRTSQGAVYSGAVFCQNSP
jgi:hypothetical protein